MLRSETRSSIEESRSSTFLSKSACGNGQAISLDEEKFGRHHNPIKSNAGHRPAQQNVTTNNNAPASHPIASGNPIKQIKCVQKFILFRTQNINKLII